MPAPKDAYIVQGPAFVIEYAQIRNDTIGHAHTIYREFTAISVAISSGPGKGRTRPARSRPEVPSDATQGHIASSS